ncbi:MAG TPA: sugar kinase [Planctomycetota bacterium]|nr:sugar kinase [Planctomycetota bacterium]
MFLGKTVSSERSERETQASRQYGGSPDSRGDAGGAQRPPDRLVVVTKKTALEELVERFCSRAQAAFYLEHAGLSIGEYEAAHEAYQASLEALGRELPREVKHHFIERSFLPTYRFGDHDLVVTLGPDGLVVNTAKYLEGQAIVACNPDPARVDGILCRHHVAGLGAVIRDAIAGKRHVRSVSMARATLNDGQTLDGFNDMFVGVASHVSARYKLSVGGRTERQSSSGILVATGAGSTGWMSSVLNGSFAIARAYGVSVTGSQERAWEDEHLVYAVREPFVSRISRADLVFGWLDPGASLTIESEIPEGGVIFSDGVEKDFLAFNSGSVATIGLSPRKARLVA